MPFAALVWDRPTSILLRKCLQTKIRHMKVDLINLCTTMSDCLFSEIDYLAGRKFSCEGMFLEKSFQKYYSLFTMLVCLTKGLNFPVCYPNNYQDRNLCVFYFRQSGEKKPAAFHTYIAQYLPSGFMVLSCSIENFCLEKKVAIGPFVSP